MGKRLTHSEVRALAYLAQKPFCDNRYAGA